MFKEVLFSLLHEYSKVQLGILSSNFGSQKLFKIKALNSSLWYKYSEVQLRVLSSKSRSPK